jgi:hypothetical protein
LRRHRSRWCWRPASSAFHAAVAQVTGGSTSGIVTDQQTAALPGATLTATAPPIGQTVTGGDGAAAFQYEPKD